MRISTNESVLFVLLFFIFLYITYKFRSSENLNEQFEKNIEIKGTLLFLTIGLMALIGGSHFAVIHAEILAKMLNVPQLIIGLTIIAIGTSLPS